MPITLTRALLGILIPGGVALASWILLILIGLDRGDLDVYKDFSIPVNASFVALIIIAGSIIEGISTHVEVRWDVEREDALQVTENWYFYLCSPYEECVAQKYIARMVTTMYFELCMVFATLSFGVGLSAVICTVKPKCYDVWSIVTIAISALISFYFWWQAKTSHQVLCTVRKEMRERSGNKDKLAE